MSQEFLQKQQAALANLVSVRGQIVEGNENEAIARLKNFHEKIQNPVLESYLKQEMGADFLASVESALVATIRSKGNLDLMDRLILTWIGL